MLNQNESKNTSTTPRTFFRIAATCGDKLRRTALSSPNSLISIGCGTAVGVATGRPAMGVALGAAIGVGLALLTKPGK